MDMDMDMDMDIDIDIDKYRVQNHIGRVLNAKAERNSKNKRQTGHFI